MKPIPQAVIQEYVKQGKSMCQLSRELGVSRSTIYRWCNGVNKPPDHKKINTTVYVIPICLRDKMKAVGATYKELARQSGVTIDVIHRALTGGRIRISSVNYLYEALNTRTFKKEKTNEHEIS